MHKDLGLYVLGGLDDATDVEAHLETCAECREEVAALRRTIEIIDDAGLDEIELPPDLKTRTLRAALEGGTIAGDRPAPVVPFERRRQPRANRFVAILAAAAVTVFAAGFGLRMVTLDQFNADRIIELASPEGGQARATARIDDTSSGQEVEMDIEGLPPAPEGKIYECWFVGEGDDLDTPNRVSAGTFRSADDEVLRMWSSADPERFPNMGVTLEDDDGDPSRTGDKVLVTVSKRPG